MRFIAIIPILSTAAALALAFLCLFAGDHPNNLEAYDILTLNTSRIAVNVFNTTASSTSTAPTTTSTGFFAHITHDIGSELSNLTTAAESDIDAALSDTLSSFARTLGLYDFYSLHVLDYCEGYYHPNGTSSRHVVSCSNVTGFSHFNPSETLQRQLNASGIDITLADLDWPTAIDNAVGDVKLAFNVLFVLYCLGIAMTAFALIGSVVGLFTHRKLVAVVCVGLCGFAFLWLLIASAIITGGATHAVNLINEYGKDIDVNAERGNKLLALTWAGTALVFIASMAWVMDFFVGRRREKKMPKQFQ